MQYLRPINTLYPNGVNVDSVGEIRSAVLMVSGPSIWGRELKMYITFLTRYYTFFVIGCQDKFVKSSLCWENFKVNLLCWCECRCRYFIVQKHLSFVMHGFLCEEGQLNAILRTGRTTACASYFTCLSCSLLALRLFHTWCGTAILVRISF